MLRIRTHTIVAAAVAIWSLLTGTLCWAQIAPDKAQSDSESPHKIEKNPGEDQIKSWIKGLSSDSYQTREESEQKLLAAGAPALSALRSTLKNCEEPEVQLRARRLVENLGLDPVAAKAFRNLNSENWETSKKAIETLLNKNKTDPAVGKKLRQMAKKETGVGRIADFMCNYLKIERDPNEQRSRVAGHSRIIRLKVAALRKRIQGAADDSIARKFLLKRCKIAHTHRNTLDPSFDAQIWGLEMAAFRARMMAQEKALKEAAAAKKDVKKE